MKPQVTLFWMRRDLRLEDNAALWMALKSGYPVIVSFVFDRNILDKLQDRKDARVLFIHHELERVNEELKKYGSSLQTYYGTPEEAYTYWISQYDVKMVFANRDYEPYARQRDQEMHAWFQNKGIEFKGAKDHVIFEKDEVMKDDGKPYTVFTPYSRKWKAVLKPFHLKPYPTLKYASAFYQTSSLKFHAMNEMNFEVFDFDFPERSTPMNIIQGYDKTRDIPSIKGTSRLSLHLRFGTISIRKLAAEAMQGNEKYLNELIWRDFYQAIIYHFPHSAFNAFKPSYDNVKWLRDDSNFAKWCEGKTGYPLVDAGMRELNATGFMHNRVRMVVASFLTKQLLIDWRLGEQYFAQKLLDYELASNVGGWQWAAGSGCDAAPYFRIFNPQSQLEKFDPQMVYVRKWVKEWGTPAYPKPIVDHKLARERCLNAYKLALPGVPAKD